MDRIAPNGRRQQLQRYRNAKYRMLEKVAENRDKPKKYQRDEDKLLISPTDIDGDRAVENHRQE